MVKLIIIRHGKPQSAGYATDELRPLSDEGREIQKEMAKKLRESGITLNLILTSPLSRAKQSAEALAEVLPAPIEEEPLLGYEFDAGTLLEKVRKESESHSTIAMVGHIPTLENLANDLVGETILPDGLSKSGCVVLEFPSEIAFGAAVFIDYYHP